MCNCLCLLFSPTSDGSAAAILCSEDFVRKHNLESQAVEILGMQMASDLPSAFKDKSCIKMVGYDMTKKAADKVYKDAGESWVGVGAGIGGGVGYYSDTEK